MKNRKRNVLDILNVILIALTNVALVLLCIFIKDYYIIFPKVILCVYGVVDVFLITLDIVGIIGHLHKDKLLKIISAVLCLFLIVGSVVGLYFLNNLNNAINTVITNPDDEGYENITVVYASYDNDSLSSLNDIKGKKIGTLTSTSDTDFTAIGVAKLVEENIISDASVCKNYSTYNDLFVGLINKEIDVAIFAEGYEDIFASNEGYEEYIEKLNNIDTYTKNIKNDNSSSKDVDITQEPFTVLLIGYAMENESSGLSDSIILASVNPQSLSVTLTSIARDSYVPIACYVGNTSDKLTHARGISRNCLIDSVENLMGVDIDYYAEVNFQGVVDIIDALGGIVVYNTVEFVGQSQDIQRGTYTVWVPGYGYTYMTGRQALAFARERHAMPGGDYDRQMNQQKVIKAIASKALELRNVNDILAVIEAAGKNFTTNIPKNQILSFINYILSANNANGKIDLFDMVKITSSRVTGYSGWMYSMSAELPLWIYRLWNGSLNDCKTLINNNRMDYASINQEYAFSFRFSYPYTEENFGDNFIIYESYPEAKVDDNLPDFIIHFEGENVEFVKQWCKEKNLPLNIVYLTDPSQGFNPNIEIGTVVEQSAKYGKLVANLSSLTIKVNGMVIDPENQVPDFTKLKYEDAVAWCKANGYSYKVTSWKESTRDNEGTIISQSIEPGEDKREHNEITFEAYDWSVVTNVSSLTSSCRTKEQILAWAKEYGMEENIEFVYIDGTDSNNDKVNSIAVTNYSGDTSDNKTIKTNSLVTVEVYKKVEEYKVEFVINGEVVSTQMVKGGKSAQAPNTDIEGCYIFEGWDKDFSNVQEDMVVTASYKNACLVTYLLNGKYYTAEEVVPGGNATLPVIDGCEGNWDDDGTNITAPRTIGCKLEN